MLKAGALYFSIVVAFLIAIICASLIILALHYRSAYLKELRFERLLQNLDSSIQWVLLDQEFEDGTSSLDLYQDGNDSVLIEKKMWGVYGLASTKTYIFKDTLKRAFLIGYADTSDKTVLYVKDENRPLSLSGETKITGEAFVPKSGIKGVFVETRRYSGTELIYGKVRNSSNKLPELETKVLEKVNKILNMRPVSWPSYEERDQHNSFFNVVNVFKVKPETNLQNALSGNIILVSEGKVVLSASAKLEGIQVYAPYIEVEDGFRGSCQLFARDSIMIGEKASFLYPSCIALIQPDTAKGNSKIVVGKDFNFQGFLFSYLEKSAEIQPQVFIGKGARISGEIYSTGPLVIEPGLELSGKVSTQRFLLKTGNSIYENILLDVNMNRNSRSKYYLSPLIIYGKMPEKKVMKWLD